MRFESTKRNARHVFPRTLPNDERADEEVRGERPRGAGVSAETRRTDTAAVSAETDAPEAGGPATDVPAETPRIEIADVPAETYGDDAPRALVAGPMEVPAKEQPDAAGTAVSASRIPRMTGHAAIEDADGLRASTETARRLACDAGAVVMRHGVDGSVLDVGRKTRTIPPALRRALQARDHQCRFPGCNARRCDAHHVRHWADGGPTRLDNLVLLCRRHHRAVHEEGFTVRVGNGGEAEFCWPDGRPFPDVPSAPRWTGPPLAPTDTHLAAAGIEIGPDTATPDWHGERLDLGYAIDVLWRPRTEAGAAGAPVPA